jgi:hypothetical protein
MEMPMEMEMAMPSPNSVAATSTVYAEVISKEFHGRPVGVGESSLHGRGVFARRAFHPGDIVDVCPVVEVNEHEISGNSRQFTYQGCRPGFLLLPAGPWMLVNYSENANLGHEEGETFMVFTALRSITEGEELTLRYSS